MRPAIRRLWLKLHRWIGIALAIELGGIALTGTLLTFVPILDRLAHPSWFIAASENRRAPLLLEDVRKSIEKNISGKNKLTFRPPREFHDTLWVIVRGDWNGTIYFDPSTGRELGRRGEKEGFYPLLFSLHRNLLLGDSGGIILAICAAAYVVLLLSGIILWWPQHIQHAFRIKWDAKRRRLLFDLHRVCGATLGIFILLSVVTGAYMAWKTLPAWISNLAGDKIEKPPKVAHWQGDSVPLDLLVAKAQNLFPHSQIGYVQFGDKQAVRVRLRVENDPHPNGLTSVWLHPGNANVLAVQSWDKLDLGSRATSIIYPYHIGELGGLPHKIFSAFVGFSLFWMAVSGPWLWWLKRKKGKSTDASRLLILPSQ